MSDATLTVLGEGEYFRFVREDGWEYLQRKRLEIGLGVQRQAGVGVPEEHDRFPVVGPSSRLNARRPVLQLNRGSTTIMLPSRSTD